MGNWATVKWDVIETRAVIGWFMGDIAKMGVFAGWLRGLPAWIALLLLGCPGLFALDPALDVSQYGHASWKVRDGFTKGQIQSFSQGPDGYLWLATGFGLYRFDGVK